MRIELTIRDSHVLIILLFITAVSAMGLVVAYGGTNPSAMGHSWGEMDCAGCIITSNLAGSSVTTAKIADNAITGAKIADGSITNADIVSAGLNADTLDGLHASGIASSWGSPCNAVWEAACSCCWYYGPYTRYCYYMGRELAVGGTSICVSSPTSQGSCGTQSCGSDYSCCY